jgi:predicted peptidase
MMKVVASAVVSNHRQCGKCIYIIGISFGAYISWAFHSAYIYIRLFIWR